MSAPKPLLRVVIENVLPEIDGGRFPITRTPGEHVTVSADIFSDGHDVVDAALQYRKDGDLTWQCEPMLLVSNDRWEARFRVASVGTYFYTLRGWVDSFKTWSRDLIFLSCLVLAELQTSEDSGNKLPIRLHHALRRHGLDTGRCPT